MKPIQIGVTYNCLYIEDIPDEIVEKIKHGEVKFNGTDYKVTGKQEDLYKVLVDLSTDYDLEVI